jgi:hypothetical protein
MKMFYHDSYIMYCHSAMWYVLWVIYEKFIYGHENKSCFSNTIHVYVL